MSGFSRRGACPSLSEPMQTGDGLLVRLSPGSLADLPPATLAEIAKAAETYGNGLLEITARGNLQLRGLTRTSARALAGIDSIANIGHAPSLPITTGPLAGIDAKESRDPGPIAEKIRKAASDLKLPARLGPKVSVVIDGGGRLPIGSISGDVRVDAIPGSRPAGRWLVSVGGNAESAKPLAMGSDDKTVSLVTKLLGRIADKGRTARGRDLTDTDLVGIRREIGARPDGIVGNPVPIGVFSLKDGRFALGIGPAFGAMTARNLAEIAAETAKCHGATVRIVPGRTLMITGLAENEVNLLKTKAEKLGFVTESNDIRLAIGTCAGKPACASGHLQTRVFAENLSERIRPLLQDGSLKLHISGCGKRCADFPGPRLTVEGGTRGCTLYLDGVGAGRPEMIGTEKEMVSRLVRMADDFLAETAVSLSAAEFLARHMAPRATADEEQA